MDLRKIISHFVVAAKKNLPFTAVIIFILLAVFLSISYNNGALTNILSYFHIYNPNITGIILFYDDNCQQCAKVDDFIKNNDIEKKVEFIRLDIFNNDTNKNILADKFKICGINPQNYGVPFLWDGQACVLGYIDVIKFFQDKTRPVN